LGGLWRGLKLWYTATRFEQDAIVAEHDAIDSKEKQQLQSLEQGIRDLKKRLSTATEGRAGLESSLRLLMSTKSDLESKARLRIDYRFPDLTAARQQQNREYAQLSQMIKQVELARSSMPQFTDLSTLSLRTPSIGGVSISLSPTELGVRYSFGKWIKGGVSASAPTATSIEATAFLEAYRVFRVSITRGTRFTPSGPPEEYLNADFTPERAKLPPLKQIAPEKKQDAKLPLLRP